MDQRLVAPDFAPGSVWLVGAGPGDPGLLTLYALHALEHADVVFHDSLVDPAILDLANPRAHRECVGKRAGRPSWNQLRINQRLAAAAESGQRVLRLKGGDPFVFGRGGEEAQALAAAGVPFRVVPAVTAGIGGTAYAGVPVTHRGTAQAVAFVTGHGAAGHEPRGVDWGALATAAPVLVLYMALRRIDGIAEALMAAYLEQRPDDGRGWIALGQARQMQMDTRGAIVAYERGLALVPDDYEGWSNLCPMRIVMEDFEGAVAGGSASAVGAGHEGGLAMHQFGQVALQVFHPRVGLGGEQLKG